MFPVHAKPEKFENVTINARFGLLFKEKSGMQGKPLPSLLKGPFLGRFSKGGRSNCRNEASFSNLSSVV